MSTRFLPSENYSLYCHLPTTFSFHTTDNKDVLISLEALLRFITAESPIPPMGLSQPIEIDYLPNNPRFTLPMAKACFSRLLLPTVYDRKEDFFSAFIKALKFGSSGYGEL